MTNIASETMSNLPHLSVRKGVRPLLRQCVRHLYAATSAAACSLVLVVGISGIAAQRAQAQVPGQASDTYKLSIPAQPLAEALRILSATANEQLLFSDELVTGKQSAPLEGTYTTDQALEILLKGSGLVVDRTPSGVLLIKDKSAKQGSVSSLTKTSRQTNGEVNEDRNFRVARNDESTDKAGVKPAGSPGENAGAADRDSKSTGPQEIVVTATKRAENVNDVPISITVVGADDISQRGLVSSEDYLRGIPGVSQEGRMVGQAIIIRGLETSPASQNFSAGTTVATYFGETPTTNSAGTGGDTSVDIKLVDIQRVEVLRGPQGTAFGSSSLGGAVRTIPMPPNLDRLEGNVKASYGVTSGEGGGDNMAQAVVNIPLVREKLALRAVAYRYDYSGFYKNVAGSDAAFQAGPVAKYRAQAFASDDDDVGAQEFMGGRAAVLFQATDQWKITLSYLNQKTEMDGIGFAGFVGEPGYTQATFQLAPEHVRDGRTHGWVDTDIAIANMTTEYDLGWGRLTATYSDTKSGTDYGYPTAMVGGVTGGNSWALSSGLDTEHRENNAEVRLATQLEGAWNFLAGVYREDTSDDYDFSFWFFGDPATNDICAACVGVRNIGLSTDRRQLEQTSAFGEVSWEMVKDLTLTGGVRRYDFERRISQDLRGPFYGTSRSNTKSEASGESYRANLSYKLNADTLVYASWAEGFRLGRPQAPLPAGICDTDNDGILDGTTGITIASTGILASDTVESYEIGTKLSFLERRLTISADVFRIDWTDVPVRALAPGGSAAPPGTVGCGRAYNANAGVARSEGVEFQATRQMNRAFRLDLGGGYIDATLLEDVVALRAHAGDRLPGSAKVNASLGLQYQFDIGGREAFLRADSIHVGSFYGNILESPDLRAGGYTKIDVNGGTAFGNLSVGLFVRNLTNRDDFSNRDTTPGLGPNFGYRLRPRSFGVQLGYSF